MMGTAAHERGNAAGAAIDGDRRVFQQATFLVLILILDLLITWSQPSADPPQGYLPEAQNPVAGTWNLAEARGWALGQDPGVESSYRRPLVSWPAYIFYRVYGVNRASSRGLGSLASLGTLIALAWMLGRRYGARPAVLGIFLLAVHPAWHAAVRTLSIGPWVAFWLLLCLSIGCGTRARFWALAAILILVGGLALDPILWIGAPALAFAGWEHGRRMPGRAAFVGTMLLGCVLAIAGGAGLAALHGVGDGGSLLQRIVHLESRSRIFSRAPALLPLAWVGALLFFTHVFPTAGGRRGLDRGVFLTLWGGIGVAALTGGATIRCASIFIPLLLYAAVSAVHASMQLDRRRRLPLANLRGAAVAVGGVAGSLYFVLELERAALLSSLPATALMLGTTGVLLVIFLGWPALPIRKRARAFLPACFLIIPMLSLPRLLPMIGSGDDSIARAAEELPALVLPGARIVGPYAHAVTMGTGIAARRLEIAASHPRVLRNQLLRSGATHLLMERPRDAGKFLRAMADGDLPLTLLHNFRICGRVVQLYRLPGATAPRSAFEEGLAALRDGSPESAEVRFLEVLKGFPHAESGWLGLGQVMEVREDHPAMAAHALLALNPRLWVTGIELAQAYYYWERAGSDSENAYRCFLNAVDLEPTCVEAHIALANIYRRRGFLRETAYHLRQASLAEPHNESLARFQRAFQKRIRARSAADDARR